jgi:hypothetical protein
MTQVLISGKFKLSRERYVDDDLVGGNKNATILTMPEGG